jgi:hypothetical protein
MRVSCAIVAALVFVGCGSVESAESEPEGPAPEARLALQLVGDGIELRGVAMLQDTTNAPEDVSVALRWVIEDGPFPPHRTTGSVVGGPSGDGEFVLRASEAPPAEALVANEATGREGVAVAYVMAYVDGNQNRLLDCRNPGDCDDVQVGASPNTMVVYAEEAWPGTGEQLFGFGGAVGVRPPKGWSLVHLQPTGTESRPIARAWGPTDTVELVVIGDFRDRDRGERRAVQPDVD